MWRCPVHSDESHKIQVFCEQVLKNAKVHSVRLRVGPSINTAKGHPDVPQLDTADHDTASGLAKMVRDGLKRAQFGASPSTRAYRVEGMASNGRAVKGVSISGRHTDEPMKAAPPSGDGTVALFAATVNSLLVSITSMAETLRFTCDSLTVSNNKLRERDQESNDYVSRLKAENARLKIRAEMGVDPDDDEPDMTMAEKFMGMVMEKKFGGSAMSKDAMLAWMDKNPGAAEDLMSDPAVIDRITSMAQKAAIKSAALKAAEAKKKAAEVVKG